MPELLTMQDLANGHLDVKALGEAANGDENTIVTTRTGNTYPSAERAINIMFQNGGLPATPFTTKALMTASALVDGDYAQVTDDTVNNGLYKKTDGVWAKSSYNPVTQAKEDAGRLDEKNLANALAIIGAQPLQIIDTDSNTSSGYYTATGIWTANSSYSTSDFIAVKKGDCVLIHHTNTDTAKFSRAMMFDSAKAALGALSNVSIKSVSDLSVDEQSNLSYSKNEAKRYQNTGIVIPSDGFIKITKSNTVIPSTNDLSGFFAAIITKKSLIEATFTHIVPKALVRELDDAWFTPVADMSIAGNGSVRLNSTTIGTAQTYTNEAGSRATTISQAYPVKKGQFVNIIGITYGRDINASIVNASNIIVQNVGTVSAFSTYTSNSINPFAYFNTEVEQDGFLRVGVSGEINSLSLVAITDSSIEDIVKYYPYLKVNDVIKPYNNLKASMWSSASSFQQYGRNNIKSNLLEDDYEFKNSATGSALANKPILLKKGDVLAFTNKTVIPTFARVFTLDTKLVGGSSVVLNDPSKSLLTTDVVNTYVAWMNGGAMPTWFGQAQETTNYICNEDHDLMVYLYTGNPASETTYGTTALGKIALLSIPEYKLIRAEKLKVGLPISIGSMSNQYLGQSTISAPVLLFKDEIIGCVTNNGSLGVTTTSKYFDGKNIGSIGYYANTGLVGLKNISGFTYENYKAQGIGAVFKVNTTSLVSLPFEDFFKVSAVYSKENRNNPNNLPMQAVISSFDDSYIGKEIPKATLVREDVAIEGVGTEKYIRTYSDSAGIVDTKYAFVKKGRYYKATGMGLKTAMILPFNNNTSNTGDIKRILPESTNINLSKGSFYFTPEMDGIVMWQSITGMRTSSSVDKLENIPATSWFQKKYYEHDLYEITEASYLEGTVTYSKEFLDLPSDGTVNINILTRFGSSIFTDSDTVLQFRQGNSVIATVKAKTANQGQSSASAAKQNINMEFLSSDDEDLYIRMGDRIEEAEMVAKSYFKTDRTQLRDSSSSELYYQIRNHESYPADGVIPNSVLSDPTLGLDLSKYKARGTTSGVPVEIYVDGDFLGQYTVRSKKKRENYAMAKSNKNHILIQADYGLGGGYMSLGALKLSSSDVRNPKISDYVEGSNSISDTVVAASISRFYNWMASAVTNPALFDSEGSQYLNMRSWHDYLIFSELIKNWDGLNNNYLIGTWDSNKWHIFAYDLDQTFGRVTLNYESPYGLIGQDLTRIYSTSCPVSRSNFFSRYNYLRSSGVISNSNINDIFRSHFNKINTYALEEDYKNWGYAPTTDDTLIYISKWVYLRIRYLDALWGYLPNDSIYLKSAASKTIAVGANYDLSLAVPDAKTSSAIKVETAELPVGIAVSATCTTNGTVLISFTNNSSASVAVNPEFIRLYI